MGQNNGAERPKSQVAVFTSDEAMLRGLFKSPRAAARRVVPRRRVVPAEAVEAPPSSSAAQHDISAADLEQWQRTRTVRGVPLPADGILDYDELAAAMRRVIERERDEVIRNGGPIEKQLISMKERLAKQIEETQLWRKRAQANAEQRNLYQEQLEGQIRANRQLRNEMNILKRGGRPKVVDLPDILRVTEATPGFEVRRQGNGHYGIYKDGVWVTDAASSGQGNKVDTATRVKLRKAGVSV